MSFWNKDKINEPNLKWDEVESSFVEAVAYDDDNDNIERLFCCSIDNQRSVSGRILIHGFKLYVFNSLFVAVGLNAT